MKYLKTYEKYNTFYWKIPIEKPYYRVALEKEVGMDEFNIDHWMDIYDGIKQDINDEYFLIYRESDFENYIDYSWLNNNENPFQRCKYMGKITKKYLDEKYPEIVQYYKIKMNADKYNI